MEELPGEFLGLHRVKGFRFGVWGLGVRLQGLELWVGLFQGSFWIDREDRKV